MTMFDINDYVTKGASKEVCIVRRIIGGDRQIEYFIESLETGRGYYTYEHELHRNIGRQRKYIVLGYEGTATDVINFEKKEPLKNSKLK